MLPNLICSVSDAYPIQFFCWFKSIRKTFYEFHNQRCHYSYSQIVIRFSFQKLNEHIHKYRHNKQTCVSCQFFAREPWKGQKKAKMAIFALWEIDSLCTEFFARCWKSTNIYMSLKLIVQKLFFRKHYEVKIYPYQKQHSRHSALLCF